MSRSPSQPNCEPATLVTLPASGRQLEIRSAQPSSLLELLDLDLDASRERQVSRALATLVTELDEPAAHALALPDRHALILALTVADGHAHVEALAECAACAERLELSLDLNDIPWPRIPHPLTVRHGSKTRACRLPTPGDLEAARDELDVIAACLDAPRDEARDEVREWSDAVNETIADCDPLGDIEIGGVCCQCGGPVSAAYDLPAVWLGRLRQRADRQLREIHVLASRYHWTEAEILRLTPSRRQAYLNLCLDPVEERREVLA